MQYKIKSLEEIKECLAPLRQDGKRIVQCHGVFDLLHPGHIHHFRLAKEKGDTLVVTVTPDCFVNKGPGRPAFREELRLKSLAALADIDFVVLNDTPDAVSAIRSVQPDLYVKGAEYRFHDRDLTGKIREEADAVEACGGAVYYTDDEVVFSSSTLLNRYFDPPTTEIVQFMERLKKSSSEADLLQSIEELQQLKVLVVGDAIIDEYQYVEPLGQSGKGLHMTAYHQEKEVFLGGSLMVANHLAQFCPHVTLLTALGSNCPYNSFIDEMLDPRVERRFVPMVEATTLTKKRYVRKDGREVSKLFETYSTQETTLAPSVRQEICCFIEQQADHYDLVLVADFGNGFTNPAIVEALSSVKATLAINAQTNSGNRGYNVVTHYKRADFISLNEPELRLAAHDRHSRLEDVLARISGQLHCPHISVTRASRGVICYDRDEVVNVPAFTSSVVDRVGAGDSYFALASLCIAKGHSHLVAGFIGSLAASLNVQVVGNKEATNKAALCKYLVRLMK